jgi:tRNA (cytidine/uridine-2'-O-)-methyltransferase
MAPKYPPMKHTHERRFDHPFAWPVPPFQVVLVEPRIPPNTGNIARLCAGTGCQLHLVEPLGFVITDARLRRAGLDYWDAIRPVIHPSFDAYLASARPAAIHLFSTGGAVSYLQTRYRPGDALVFGSETEGLPDRLLAAHPDRVRGIPIQTRHIRSLNLATAAGIVIYEALRQQQDTVSSAKPEIPNPPH